jgi:hypothetical protein
MLHSGKVEADEGGHLLFLPPSHHRALALDHPGGRLGCLLVLPAVQGNWERKSGLWTEHSHGACLCLGTCDR